MTHLTDILTNILAFAFALGVIIVVHEAGHLMVAKAFGVRVLTFSVGFGKRIWAFRRGETEYRLSAIPLGGYVRLGGENPDEVSDDPREFLNKPRWQRILVYLAGPAMNVILAIVLFAALFMVGIEVMNLPDAPPLIGGVEEGSSAAQAGLKRGDLIVAVKGEPVDNWQDVAFAVMGSPEKAVPLTVKRDGQTVQASVTPRRVRKNDDIGDLGGLVPSLRPQIIQVIAGQPAEAAGFRPGDEVRAVAGRPVVDSQAFVDAIAQHPGQRIEVQVVRDGKPLVLAVTPKDVGGAGKIGVQIGFYQRYGPARAFVESVRYNIQTVRDTFKILGKIFSRELSPKGALGLMQLMPATAQRYGISADQRATIEKKLFDPRINIAAGSRYLRDLIAMFPGQIELALAAYNAGEGAVQRAGNKIPNYKETQNYVKTVLQLYAHLKPDASRGGNGRVPGRVRMELPGNRGGAIGRGNLPGDPRPMPSMPAAEAVAPTTTPDSQP